MVVLFNSCFDTRCFELTHRPTKTRGVEVCHLSEENRSRDLTVLTFSREVPS